MSLLNPCFWGREGGKYSPGSDKLTKESLGECYSLIIDSQWNYSGEATVIGRFRDLNNEWVTLIANRITSSK